MISRPGKPYDDARQRVSFAASNLGRTHGRRASHRGVSREPGPPRPPSIAFARCGAVSASARHVTCPGIPTYHNAQRAAPTPTAFGALAGSGAGRRPCPLVHYRNPGGGTVAIIHAVPVTPVALHDIPIDREQSGLRAYTLGRRCRERDCPNVCCIGSPARQQVTYAHMRIDGVAATPVWLESVNHATRTRSSRAHLGMSIQCHSSCLLSCSSCCSFAR